ncbi:integral membrane protein [Lactobacillus selangorensis]|uniref:Integral membrane protein n=1 Tax=Lactobacillus selangorensis TaxID=81857 RepID=A0A0R2G0F4_9LACO|nr:Bax inhibitor-1/YccA family protein [Lactobacillus selangorensis]KRN29745.1 integral membrane protein [Lactobacillus selangorensis]KRN33726.1 integral membrane protein [Lactobacillus selangorensis]
MQENQTTSRDRGLALFFNKVYGYMTAGIAVSAVVAYLVSTVFKTQWINLIANNRLIFYVILFIPFILVWGVSRNSYRNPTGGFLMFMLLSVSYGLQFSLIAMFYSGANIAAAFVSSAGVFAAMSIYGRVTKNNLSNWGRTAFAFLIGIIIASLVNMFIHSSVISYILSYATLIIFIIMTASDNQKLTLMYQRYGSTGQVSVTGLAIQGALSLYLDFINIFLSILEIFGYGSNRN